MTKQDKKFQALVNINKLKNVIIKYDCRLKRTKSVSSKIMEVHRILREEEAQRNNTVVAQEFFAKPDGNITAGFKKSKGDLVSIF